MARKKSPPELVRLFDELIPRTGDVGRRPMFGYPAAFANGYLFAGLFEDHMLLRLGAHMDAFRAIGGAPFEPRAGTPMTGFLLVPPGLLADPQTLAPWIDRALATALNLPAKPPKGKHPPARS
ncbi:MAG: TfoX/Sxy family protein [Sulfobacillus sp.]